MRRANNFSQKSTGTYRCIDDINNLIIRIRIEEIFGESTINEAESEDVVESKDFHWQEKVFGRWEREFYKDKDNCVTDLDNAYHSKVSQLLSSEGVLYSHIDVDEFCRREEPVWDSKNITYTSTRNWDLDDEKSFFNDRHKLDFGAHLQECVRDPFFKNDYQYMYIMADFGEYSENTWIKSEYILCCLKYDHSKKILFVYPDFTDFHSYRVTINNDMSKSYRLTIENTSELEGDEIPERERRILDKIVSYERKLKEHAVGVDFATPPCDSLSAYVFFEILTAKVTEYDDIFVQYTIDLPDRWACRGEGSSLNGSTHSCRARKGTAHFSFTFETILCCDLKGIETAPSIPLPAIYFEIVSKDTWDRYRTEGLCYKRLPILQPGSYTFEMDCFRISPGSLTGNLRRFFIGDYRSYDDVRWIATPKGHEERFLNKYGVRTTSTGRLAFKMNVVHQSQCFWQDRRQKLLRDRLVESSAPLIKSVQQVLEAFKTAKRNMTEARRRI
ncbi:hypothetical protein Trydic_g21819 [Trypoxylus dichotomus]